MAQLISKLRGDRPCLIVSLVENDLDAARAAVDSGADALKLHLNMHHLPSGARTGSFEEERTRVEAILAEAKVPVGIVPRPTIGTTVDETVRFRDMGFDFIDFYPRSMSPAVLAVPDMTKMVAVEASYDLALIQETIASPWAEVLEAAILPAGVYGAPLSVEDLLRLSLLARLAAKNAKPVIVPTDRRIQPDDVPALIEAGLKNLMIGVMVTGRSASGIASATAAFRKVMDAQ